MECNKDEAIRAKVISEKKLMEKDYVTAKKFALKAQNLFPALEGVIQLISTLDVYIASEHKANGESDWYSILCVSSTADEDTLKKQYRKLALLLHPDKNKCVGAEGAFKLISEAWSVLSDKFRRMLYDQKLQLFSHSTKNRTAPCNGNGFPKFSKNRTAPCSYFPIQPNKLQLFKVKEVLSRDDSEYSDESDNSDDSDDSNDGNNQQSHGEYHSHQSHGEYYGHQSHQDDQHDTGMTWAQGHENYYATQDTDHRHPPRLEGERRFLPSLSESPDTVDKEHLIGSSQEYMSVEEHMKYLVLRGNQRIPVRNDYESRSYNWGSQDIKHGPIGYQSSRYGYYDSDQSKYDSFDRSSYTSGIRHHESEGYFDNAQNVIPDYSPSLWSNFEQRESSSATCNSVGYQSFGNYNRRDQTLLQSQSSNSEHLPSTESNEYSYGQFNANLYRPSYVEEQFNQNETQGEYNEYLVPPRHSSWY